ncbi:hypothetical protein AAC387_Pa03g4436 [Persea americana]
MVNTSKQSFSFSTIGKFVGQRPSLEALEQWITFSWRLSRLCLISLTEKGNFIFRFYSKEDRDDLVGHSPLFMDRRKLLLESWLPGQDESNWPSETPIWIRLRGIPYHCWSSDILLSIAASIGKPLRLDETTAKQRMLSFARVQVLLDVARANPRLLIVELEGEDSVTVEVQYERFPCSECLLDGHQSSKCPFSSKSGLVKTPTIDPVLIVPTSQEREGS